MWLGCMGFSGSCRQESFIFHQVHLKMKHTTGIIELPINQVLIFFMASVNKIIIKFKDVTSPVSHLCHFITFPTNLYDGEPEKQKKI